MSKKKKQKIDYNKLTDPKRIAEQEYLHRWEKAKSPPTVWEKMDKDPAYESALKNRVGDPGDPNLGTQVNAPTMSNKWGIGKPRG